MKSFFKFIIIAVIVLFVAGIAFVVFGVPRILNSGAAIKKYEKFLSEKTGVDVAIDGFLFKLNRDLTFVVTAKTITAQEHKTKVIDFQDIEYRSKRFSWKPEVLNVRSIYLDFEKLKPRLNNDKKSGGNSLKMDYLPVINIKQALVRFDEKSSAKFVNIYSEKKNGTVFCAFTGYLTVPYSNEPIIIGEDGYLYFTKNVNFEDFTLRYKSSKLYLSGAIDNLNFNGKDLSIYDLEKFFVFFYKKKHPGKRNFIENFNNFKGLLDVDLRLSKDGLNGKCVSHNLSADFSNFKIPVILPSVVFYFTGRNMNASAVGTFGVDKVYTDVLVKGIATSDVVVSGNVKSTLSSEFSKRYFPSVQIAGNADASVKYLTKDKKVTVIYSLGVKPGNNILTHFGGLDNLDKYRVISAETFKSGDNLYVKSYDYSFKNNNQKQLLLSGNGLFKKSKGHFIPGYFTLKTNAQVPVSLVEAFVDDYISGGTFSADLKYDFTKKYIDGVLSVYNSRHEDFMEIQQADIKVSNDKVKVNVDGKFFSSPIKMSLIAVNNFRDDILIDSINIDLDRFYIRRGDISTIKSSFDSHSKPAKTHSSKQYNFDVKQGKIRVGEIIHPKIYLRDVGINGEMHNNIVDFIVPQTAYADGTLSAVGKYNVRDHSSDIYFLASDINSNSVATKIFNLPNQFEGLGFATLHMKTKNKLNEIHAHATFAIADGFLPKLGSKEIILSKKSNKKSPFSFLKKTFKFTLSKITNIDFSKPNVFYSDLRGSFIMDNSCVHDVKIFSQSDNLSILLLGNYDISSQIGSISVWGRENKIAARKIKIFKIPLSLIHKLLFRIERTKQDNSDIIRQIPPVKAEPADQGFFRVNINGNLNSDDIKFDLKEIR